MKKLYLLSILALSSIALINSCSTEEEDTSPPPSIVITPKPEPTPAPVQYTLTVTAGEGGTVSSSGGTYYEGTSVTITATPNEGYEFVGWSDGSTNFQITLNLNGNTNLTAEFKSLLQGFYPNETFPLTNINSQYSNTSLAADLDNDGNDELILTIADPAKHTNSNLIEKNLIKVISVIDENFFDVTNKFFDDIPSTFFTRQIFFEDLNHDGLKDLYFANHGAEPDDLDKYYHLENERIDGLWCEQDLIYFNRGDNYYEKANYFNLYDYNHGAGIIKLTSDGKNSIIRNETSPPPKQLGGKNSIVTFSNGEFIVNNVLSNIEDNLYQEYFCSGSLWVYPIDTDSDGIDELVTQNKIFKITNNIYSSSNLIPGVYEQDDYYRNEGGFVYDMDNDGDEDLIKSSSKTDIACNFIDTGENQIEFYENINGELIPSTGKLPQHPNFLSKSLKPFDVNFDGLMDIVFYGVSSNYDPKYFFMNNGNGFELKEFKLDQFDGYVILNGQQTRIQQFPNLRYSWFLKNNDDYIFVTGIELGLVAYRITSENLNLFIK